MIRAGESKDIPVIIRMAEDFWQHTIYDEDYEPEMVDGMTQMCIDQGLMAVVEIDEQVVGFACGVKGPLLANSQVLCGTEVAWWVDPEHRGGRNGVTLLKFLENMAKSQGVKYWTMIFMESSMPETVKGMYSKMGYVKNEESHTKVL